MTEVQITAELLDELDSAAKATPHKTWGRNGSLVCPSRVEGGTTYVESWRPVAVARGSEYARFIAAANPATILALTAHIHSLTEQLQALRTWRRVDDELPEPGVTVLACYTNSHGKTRRIRAEYVAPKSREADGVCDEDECNVEYDEETDQYYWKAGWYELLDNWSDYSHLAVTEGDITHWIPLPAAPAIAQEGADHE